MTAENLISFFKVLPFEEQEKFVGMASKIIEPKKVRLPKQRKQVLTQEEAFRYLTETHFNKKTS